MLADTQPMSMSKDQNLQVTIYTNNGLVKCSRAHTGALVKKPPENSQKVDSEYEIVIAMT